MKWIIGIAVIIIFLMSCGDGPPTKDQLKKEAGDQGQEYVKNSLHSPTTAKFSNLFVSEMPDSIYITSGYVDAQNVYGATLRNSWTVKMKYSQIRKYYKEEKNWKILFKDVSP